MGRGDDRSKGGCQEKREALGAEQRRGDEEDELTVRKDDEVEELKKKGS